MSAALVILLTLNPIPVYLHEYHISELIRSSGSKKRGVVSKNTSL